MLQIYRTVISNLEEDTTIEDIKAIIKGSIPEEALEEITVYPTGSMRSKIIKDVDPSLVSAITKRVGKKWFKGRLPHCRPHVPITPPKPVQVAVIPPDKTESTAGNDSDTAEVIPVATPADTMPAQVAEVDEKNDVKAQ